jgi:DinB family protein
MLDLSEEILKSLRASPVILGAFVAGLDDEQIRRRPAPGEWAVIEVVAHVADVDERAHARLRRMLAEDNPFLPAFDQDTLAVERGYIGLDLPEQVARYRQSRAAHLADLAGLDRRQWQRTGRHEAAGDLTVQLYEAHVASEDVDHLAQIARLLDRSPQD